MSQDYDLQDYPHSELTEKIIGAAMKVHSALGPGFLEKIYENALLRQLSKIGLSAGQQVRYPVNFDGFLVGEHFLDIVVEGKVYVELKCHPFAELEKAQVASGLKASGVELALLINFNCLHLKGNFTRIVRSNLYDLLKESASRMNHLPAQPPNDQEV
jgi:GxxExxY protein